MASTATELPGRTAAELVELLAAWLPEQRWYGAKDGHLHEVVLETALELVERQPSGDAPALWYVVARAVFGDGTDSGAQRYQILLGARCHLPERLQHAIVGTVTHDECPEGAGRATPGHTVVYDATHDPDLMRWLLDRFAEQERIGPLEFHLVPGTSLPDHGERQFDTLASLVLTGEQSNTSLVYGSALILKLFRRLVPGINPDLELALALRQAGSQHIPIPVGWLQAELPNGSGDQRVPTTLGILQEFLPTATDGWVLAQTSVRDLFADPELRAGEAGGDFAPESHRLGAATAEVHRDLAATLPVEQLSGRQLADLASTMAARLAEAVNAAPALGQYAESLSQAIIDLANLDHPLLVQRIHGDFHLGQVMRTPTQWVLLDFEGEPARPLTERRALSSPLRDVAAMLRSFDYAAHHMLASTVVDTGAEIDPLLVERASEWSRRNCDAFCAGYSEVTGIDPREESVVLRAFEIDKAVYEVVYEMRNRPGWTSIPLAAVRRLAGSANEGT